MAVQIFVYWTLAVLFLWIVFIPCQAPDPYPWLRMAYNPQLLDQRGNVLFLWGFRRYKICFSPVHLPCVNLIIRSAKESRIGKGKSFLFLHKTKSYEELCDILFTVSLVMSWGHLISRVEKSTQWGTKASSRQSCEWTTAGNGSCSPHQALRLRVSKLQCIGQIPAVPCCHEALKPKAVSLSSKEVKKKETYKESDDEDDGQRLAEPTKPDTFALRWPCFRGHSSGHVGCNLMRDLSQGHTPKPLLNSRLS